MKSIYPLLNYNPSELLSINSDEDIKNSLEKIKAMNKEYPNFLENIYHTRLDRWLYEEFYNLISALKRKIAEEFDKARQQGGIWECSMYSYDFMVEYHKLQAFQSQLGKMLYLTHLYLCEDFDTFRAEVQEELKQSSLPSFVINDLILKINSYEKFTRTLR